MHLPEMIKTVKHLCYTLKIEEPELTSILDNIDKFYYEKLELKKNKDESPALDKFGKQKKRILHPSINRLKTIQQRIIKGILIPLGLPDYAHGAVKGKDNIENAKQHQGKKYIFTTDLKDFFPSIRHSQVFATFSSLGFSPTVASLLTKLTTYKGKLPQGAPTSPAIANLVFLKTGKKLAAFAAQNGITFTSFIDDLTFSAPVDFKGKLNDIIAVIKEDGFKISHKKTNYKTKNPVVTGIVVKNNRLDLPASFITKIDNACDDYEKLNGLLKYIDRVTEFKKS